MKFYVKFGWADKNISYAFDNEKSFLSLARSLKKNLSFRDYCSVNYLVVCGTHVANLCRYSFVRDLNCFKTYLKEKHSYEL